MTKQEKVDVVDNLEILVNLFQDKISELHKVKGGQYERHAFIYYRNLVWKIQELVK